MARLRRTGSFLALIVAVTLASCGDGTITGGDSNGTTDQISVRNNFFSPRNSTLPEGTTVTWTWNSGGVQHTVTFNDGPTSGILTAGTYQRTFATAGTYPYICGVHGAAMSGSIIIEAP